MVIPQFKILNQKAQFEKAMQILVDFPQQASVSIRVTAFINFILVNAGFLTLNFIKRSTFVLDAEYITLLIVFNIFWAVSSLYFGKFDIRTYPNQKNLLLAVTKSNLVLLYLVSIFIVLSGFYEYSRLHVFGSVALLAAGEWILYSLFYYLRGRAIYESRHGNEKVAVRYKDFSIRILAIDFLLLVTSFFLVNYYKRGTFALNPDYEQFFLLIAGVWVIGSVMTRKFNIQDYQNIWYAAAPYIKATFLMTTAAAVMLFALRMFEFSRLQLFGTFILFFALETVVFLPYLLGRLKKTQKNGDVEKIEDVKAILQQELLPLETNSISQFTHDFKAVRDKLHDVYLKSDPKLFDMLDRFIDLDEYGESQTAVVDSHNMYNIDVIENHTKTLIINLHKVNDFRWLNRYFLNVHKKIYNGGYFAGRAHTIETHKKFIFRKYPKAIAYILYPLDFIWNRVFPKMPGFKQLYFIITRGQNRVLSKAEILGRLSFCGFKIISAEVFNDSLYFIARRLKTPSVDANPSYGLTIKLQRIGLDGKMIYINKLRTMHPYSEYLQEYIYQQNKLNESGKFKNDFRLTEWGQLFRKLWIDELPQIFNYIRGEINLVGVRALSQHYFNLYPEDLKNLRIQFKPGLVPPYYADMPKNFDEIVDSERRYLLAKRAHPLTTDIIYFFKALHNILFNKARSQ
jgi:hypothetical protein